MRQQEYWNDYAGAGWADNADALERINAPMGANALQVAAAAPGEYVLDIGCGTGASTRELAHAVGAGGGAIGVDISVPMITAARSLSADLPWVEFLDGDIETLDLPSNTFDLAFSRMCLMLLDNPAAGMATIARALRPGGRLVATTFRSAADNPWLPLVVLGAAPHVDPLPALPLQGEPGPFAFADAALPRALLEAAGFRDVRVTAHDGVLELDPPPEQAVGILIELGPAGGVYRAASEERKTAARASVAALLARYGTDAGGLALPYGTWLITAERPADVGV